ncbi:hypothetical protein AAHA92_27112 [Salvia divinorum]|uniref:Uncharacterized protein n=1 Tax=Salvia divinorum TaxID=28513 RepID=A0ABD1G2L7_SALDI
MGKSRGERRVIFSSSGAMPTINDLRWPRATIELRQLGKGDSGGRAFVIEEEAVNNVDEVEATNSTLGVEGGRQRDKDKYAIGGGACRWGSDFYLLFPMPTDYPLVQLQKREMGERAKTSQI